MAYFHKEGAANLPSIAGAQANSAPLPGQKAKPRTFGYGVSINGILATRPLAANGNTLRTDTQQPITVIFGFVGEGCFALTELS